MFYVTLYDQEDEVVGQFSCEWWHVNSDGEFETDFVEFDIDDERYSSMNIVCDVEGVDGFTLEHNNSLIWH